ncbi:hypothetical protein C8A05DRAFT_35853 [Staphylotrichum tortipilum]|uniref:DUF7918 domain-containing protein n=1 Tax=Staphylotrichum tortipilum TaxID=2831512 RepID=A0AAN6RR97_9PEZI|nr:hypothetical protein C8A05DRAFT_35853 [Staphylotrichum longicolle]
MAITPSIPGLSVSVKVRGITAFEYNDPDAEDRPAVTPDLAAHFDLPPGAANLPLPRVVKYIKAEPNALFCVQVSKAPSFERRSHHIAYELQLDGQRNIFEHECYDGRPLGLWISKADSQRSGNQTNGYKRHKFVFSAVSVIEGASLSQEALKEQTKLSECCGTLKVLFYRMDWCLVGQNVIAGPVNPPDLGPAELSEKALKGKAIDCTTSFVTEGSCNAPKTILRGYSDPSRRPFAVFEFRYRFQEGLIREGVIPRPIPIYVDEEDPMPADGTWQRPIHIKEENRPVPAVRAKQELADAQGRRGLKREAAEEAEAKSRARSDFKERRLENGRVQVDLTDD